MKTPLRFLVELPIRFILALIGFTIGGWIGWLGIALIVLKTTGVLDWPWWVAALPLEYGALYCLYMTVDGALYRAGIKDVGGYASFTSFDSGRSRFTSLNSEEADLALKLSNLGMSAPEIDSVIAEARAEIAAKKSSTSSKDAHYKDMAELAEELAKLQKRRDSERAKAEFLRMCR